MRILTVIPQPLPPPPGIPLGKGEEFFTPLFFKNGLGVVSIRTHHSQGIQP